MRTGVASFVSGRAMAIVVALTTVAAACAPTAAPAPAVPAAGQPAPAATKAPAPVASPAVAQPKYGGTLKLIQAIDPASLDPHQDVNAHVYTAPAYNLLVQYDGTEGKKIVPDIAESWDTSPDGKTYTFKIRKGPIFHDGQPLISDDVTDTLEKLVRPPKGVRSQLAFLLGPATDSIERVDDSTVRVKLKYAFSPLLASLAIDYAPIYPKHVLDKNPDALKTTLVGTGPFKLKSYTPGIGVELVKNPGYWVKDHPYLDGITFVLIQDSATRLAAARTHQVNMTGKIFEAFSPAEVETIKKDAPSVTFLPVRSTPGPWLFMNSRKSPFSDLRVRRAVSLAIDRDAAIKVVAQGSGKLGGYFNILEGWDLTDQELRQIPGYSANKDAEREQAKKLMADAGYASGFDLSILSRTNTLNQTASTFVAGQLQSIGVRAKVEVLEDGVFFSRGGKGDFQTMLFTPAILVADPIWQGRYFIPGGTLDFTGNEVDEKLKDLWLKQAQETNDAKRHDLIKEVSRQSLDQAYALPLVWPDVFTAYWPEVHGVVLAVTDYAANRFDNVWLSQ